MKGEAGAREAGKFRLEGKDYVVADGDVLHFRFANHPARALRPVPLDGPRLRATETTSGELFN